MIRLALSPRMKAYAHRQPWLTGLASRFVGGSTVDDVLDAAESLAGRGIASSVFFLGEYVTEPAVISR